MTETETPATASQRLSNTRQFRGQHRCPKCGSWKTGTNVSWSTRPTLTFGCDACDNAFEAENPEPW